MPMYVIERGIPGAGSLPAEEVAALSKRSCSVLQQMGPEIRWLQSFVTENKLYCIYIAPDEETIREHARLGDFPADSILAVSNVIDPSALGGE